MSEIGKSATKLYVRIASGSTPTTGINAAFPHTGNLRRKRHAALVLPRSTVWRTSNPSNCG